MGKEVLLKLSGNTVINTDNYMLLFFTNNFENIGLLSNDVSNPNIPVETNPTFKIPFIISGYTDNTKLNELKTYSNEFKVGINGVTSVSSNLISYRLDGIDFITYISGSTSNPVALSTIYFLGSQNGFINGLNSNNSVNEFTFKDESKPYIEELPTRSQVFVQRNPASVYDSFFALNNINSYDDVFFYFNS